MRSSPAGGELDEKATSMHELEKVRYGLTPAEKKALALHHRLWQQQAEIGEFGFVADAAFQCGRCPERSFASKGSGEPKFSDAEFPVFAVAGQHFVFNPNTLELARISTTEAAILCDAATLQDSAAMTTLKAKLAAAGWLERRGTPPPVGDSYLSPALRLELGTPLCDHRSGLATWLSQMAPGIKVHIAVDNTLDQLDAGTFAQFATQLQHELGNQDYVLGLHLDVHSVDSAWTRVLVEEGCNLVLRFRWPEVLGNGDGDGIDLGAELTHYLRKLLDTYVGMITAQVSGVMPDPLAVIQFLADRGFRSVDIASPWWHWPSAGSNEALPSETIHFLRSLVDLATTRLAEAAMIDFPLLSETWRRLYHKKPRYHYCGAGVVYGALDKVGVLACHKLKADSAAVLAPDSWPFTACATCWARHLCGGYCPYDLAQGNGVPDCTMRRQFYALAVESFLTLYTRSAGLLRKACSAPEGLLQVEVGFPRFDVALLYVGG